MKTLCALAALLCWGVVHADNTVLITRSDGVTVWFEAEVADHAAARQRGLMERTTLPQRHGMWFDFERSTDVSMWMKNTLIALDMLFIRADGEVVAVHAQARPHDLSRITAPTAVRYVLEINGGEAAQYAIERGATARLSASSRR